MSRLRLPLRVLAVSLACLLPASPGLSTPPAPAAPANRLIDAASPYLRQHAHNPVDWYPWGEEAFARARRDRKPILLSIGYSTCHWCHVMERESFSDPAIAALLNRHFVCIKVDREERPDLDRVYLAFVQATTGAAGWPMTVWLTPDLKPFFGGSYFPPHDSHGQPGLVTVATRIATMWSEHPEQIGAQSERMYQALLAETRTVASSTAPPVADLRARGIAALRATFDATHGGFDRAPKFPNAVVLHFLLDVATAPGDAAARASALDPALATLRALARGGIRDHLGGGFHRYTVDAAWRVPHFEKMLCDQAQLAGALLAGWQLSADPALRDAALSTLDYLRRDLQSPDGAFYTAEDADSARPGPDGPHAEGAFYVWTAAELAAALNPTDAPLFAFAYGLAPEGNVAPEHGAELAGRNLLYRAHDDAACAARFGLAPTTVATALDRARAQLLAQRAQRPRPHRDEKILTAWNGLALSAFARAATALRDPEYAATAVRTATFLQTRLFDPATGRLRHSFHADAGPGRLGDEAFADDYAFLIRGLLDLYSATFDPRWLAWAVRLQTTQNELFGDPAEGGYFATTTADPSVLLRLKPAVDNAEPSVNSVAIANLARLAALLHRDDWRLLAERTARAFATPLADAPLALPEMLAALGWLEGSPRQIFVVGEPTSPRTQALVAEIWRQPLGHTVIARVDAGSRPWLDHEIEFVRSLPPPRSGDDATAYVCENFVCQLPTGDPATLAKLLRR